MLLVVTSANNQVCPPIHSMMKILKFYGIKLACNEEPFIPIASKPQQDAIVPGLDRREGIVHNCQNTGIDAESSQI